VVGEKKALQRSTEAYPANRQEGQEISERVDSYARTIEEMQKPDRVCQAVQGCELETILGREICNNSAKGFKVTR
jgi:hypothetical protein